MGMEIEKGTIRETLLLPLYARKVCMDRYPKLFYDEKCRELIDRLDFHPEGKRIPLYSALTAGVRQYDLAREIEDYLEDHPEAAVVNLGCGLDTTFQIVDNGRAFGYNFDHPDVIKVRNELLPPGEREKNLSCDLNDFSWFEEIDFSPERGAVFIAGGVFYYFTEGRIRRLLDAMARHFKGGRIAFDVTTPLGLMLIRRAYMKKNGFIHVETPFALKHAEVELENYSHYFLSIREKRYMTGYRKPDPSWGRWNNSLAKLSDDLKLTRIVQIDFKK